MSLCARVSLRPDDFRLSETLSTQPPVRIEFERVVPVSADRGAPSYLWVSETDTATALKRLRADPDLTRVEVVVQQDERHVLVEVDWDQSSHPLLDALQATEATCLKGVGEAEQWRFTLRFRGRPQLAECYRHCAGAGVDIVVDRIWTDAWSAKGGLDLVLTDCQRETLETALKQGYFAIPRKTTLQELGAELGVSDTAVSQRLRRGVTRLLNEELP